MTPSRRFSANLKRYHGDREFDHNIHWLTDTQKAESTGEWGQKNGNPDFYSAVPILLSNPRSNLPTTQRIFCHDTELTDLHPDATGRCFH